MNWLDWLMLLIIFFSAWRGLHTGFIASAAGLAGLVLGLAAAFIGYAPLALYMENRWGWGGAIATFINDKLPLSVLDELIKNDYMNNLQITVPGVKATGYITNMVYQAAMSILEIISFLLLLVAVSLLVKIVLRMFSGAVAHTFFSPLDRFGGLLLGVVRGLVIITLMAILLEPLLATGAAPVQGDPGFLGRAVAGSALMPYVWHILNILNMHIPAWQSLGDIFKSGGSNYIYPGHTKIS
jgi:uncharacterized membrane protein required for colicin V production